MARFEEFFVDQNSQFKYELTLFDEAGGRFNLDNHTVTCQIRKTHSSDDVVATPLLTKANGVIGIELTDEQTLLLTDKRYVFDVYIEGLDQKKRRVLEGNVIVSPTVTR